MNHSSSPASFAQQRLWFLDQLESGTAAYNLARAFRIRGPLDIPCLTRAVQAVVKRHESLRTVFDAVDGQAEQIILPEISADPRLVDLTIIPDADRESEAVRLAREESKKPFDLSRGPLFRSLLLRLRPAEHLLVLAMHHIITDGWSIAVLFKELTKCYEAFVRDQKPDLPELPVQYAEFTQWQREYVTGEILDEQVQYWKKKLSGAPTHLDLPTDHPRPSVHTGNGGTEEFVLDTNTFAALKVIAQEEGATAFMISLAAFQGLLWRYTMQDSILVGTPVAGRKELDIENLIGFFVNTLVFRADFRKDLTFRELLRQVRAFALDAYGHQDIPFERLVEELAPQRSSDTTPLFQVMFTFQNIPKQVFQISGLDMEEVPFETGISKFDISVDAYESEGLHFRFEYNTDLFEKSTILRMMRHLEALLRAIGDNPDQLLAKVPLLSAEERQQILIDWNRTNSDYPRELTIHAAFERQVSRAPDAIALLCGDKKLTYGQVNEAANRMSHYLMRCGIRPGDRLGIAMERSPEMIVALLATLKSGAAYVPLDPSYPNERLAFLIEDASVWGVLTVEAFAQKLNPTSTRVIITDAISNSLRNETASNPLLEIGGEDRAYIIYTSGSTGTPKGVEANHRACLNRFAWMWQAYPFATGEICCQKTNLTFVDSVWEIFGPLLAGVANVIIPQEVVRDPEELLQVLGGNGVTRIVLVPSLLRTLLDHAPNLGARVPELRLWSCSGEVLTLDLARRFRSAYPYAKLLNIYGSSEVAADVTSYEVGELEGLNSVPIGRPISNTHIYILDEYGKPVPAGVRGQIYVGGDGVALGYWNRPELTAERFLLGGVEGINNERLFRTGDLGRWRGDAEIEYFGRVDSQVKLRGMRLELGEVDAALASHEHVRAAAVDISGEGDHQGLVAYLVAEDGATLTVGELRRYLRSRLPEHMVPGTFVQLQALPLLSSGKVNRKALAEAPGKVLRAESAKVLAKTAVEQKVSDMWKEVLKVDEIGVDENFFELGGHSLLVLQVLARVRKVFEVELPVRVMFERATVAEVAKEVEKAQAAGQKVRTPALQRRPRPAISGSEALLAHLDTLSAAEVQALLQRALVNKQPSEAVSSAATPGAAAVGEV